jgi:hypothetical protein
LTPTLWCKLWRRDTLSIVSLLEIRHPARPAGHAKAVLRRHPAPFAIIVAKLKGIEAVLIDNDDDIQPAFADPDRRRGKHDHNHYQAKNAQTI